MSQPSNEAWNVQLRLNDRIENRYGYYPFDTRNVYTALRTARLYTPCSCDEKNVSRTSLWFDSCVPVDASRVNDYHTSFHSKQIVWLLLSLLANYYLSNCCSLRNEETNEFHSRSRSFRSGFYLEKNARKRE